MSVIWKMVGRYADDEEIYVDGYSEEDCVCQLIDLQKDHGELEWYSGVNGDGYIDGEYVGEDEDDW